MDIHELFGPIERIEDPPFTHRIFAQIRQIRRDRFVAQVFHVRHNPLRLLKQPLCCRNLNGREVVENGWVKRETIPGHNFLPVKPELLRDLFARQPLPIGQRSLEACPHRFAELETQVGIADQLAEPIVHHSTHELLQFLGRERRQFHEREDTEARAGLQRGTTNQRGLTLASSC